MMGDWLGKVGLDVYDDPSPPPPVQPEKTPELTFNLPSKSLDTLFSAHLLGNETPEPNGVKEFLATPEHEHEESQARVKEVSTAADYQSSHQEDSRGAHKASGVPVISLYERLMDRLMDELETLSHIKITHQLFSDENGAISHIVNEVYKRLLNKRLMKGASCFDPWAIDYAAGAILVVLTVLWYVCSSPVLPQTLTLLWRHHRSCLKFRRTQISSQERMSSKDGATNLSTWSCSTILSELGLSEFEDLIRK
ncbi:hypothetical protein AOLI_G00180230 [Acnodon oligacanthus]